MLRKLIECLLATLPVVLIVAFLIFLMLRLSPGDPALIMAGDNASPQDVERIRIQLGLDQPLLLSFLTWLGNVLRGDLGTSLFANMPVTALIAQRLEPTLMLAGFATLFSVTLAVPLGVLAATRQGSWIDRGVMVFVVLGFSMPVFLIGYGSSRSSPSSWGGFPSRAMCRSGRIRSRPCIICGCPPSPSVWSTPRWWPG